jgi:phosphoglycerate-specific signal transduction histidine kinase
MQLSAAQELIKAKAKELVAQNQDYAKIVSQLNRYYYQLQDVRENISLLSQKLGTLDPLFENKLDIMQQELPLNPSEFTSSQESKSEKELKR